jgi:NADH:ubiquinone oxidoreductase subunit 6 (subunit J)
MHLIPVTAFRESVYLGNISPLFLITMQTLNRWQKKRVSRHKGEKEIALIVGEKHLIPVTAFRESVYLGNISPLFLITMQTLNRWQKKSFQT